jgi:hypothetical protein
MAHPALRSRSRLLLAPALTLAVASPLALAPSAFATGSHDSGSPVASPNTGSDNPCNWDNKPKPEQPTTPPAADKPPTPETPAAETPTVPETAPAPETPAAPVTPAPVVEQAAAPAPAPAPAAPAPAAAAPAPAPAAPAAPVEEEAEEEQAEVLGETAESAPDELEAPVAATAAAPAAASAEELPFTGLDTGLIAIMGAGLLGGGIVLRRRTQSTQ